MAWHRKIIVTRFTKFRPVFLHLAEGGTVSFSLCVLKREVKNISLGDKRDGDCESHIMCHLVTFGRWFNWIYITITTSCLSVYRNDIPFTAS